MIINDTERVERLVAQRAIDQEREDAVNYALLVEEQSVNLKDLENNPTIVGRQLGQQMTHQKFEEKLNKINPNFTFRDHPSKADKRCLFHNQKGFLFVYEAGLMPEFSIRDSQEQTVYDPGFKNFISRGDLPKSERVPHEFNPDGTLKTLGKVIWEPGAIQPGFKKQDTLWREIKRGWRTVLSKLVFQGYLTVGAVEREFGPANRLSWAQNMGKVQ